MYSGQNGCIGANGCFLAKWLYSAKVAVVGQNCCNRGNVVVFLHKWLYEGKSGFIQEKVVVFG